jgi:uncharacterized protein (TIGR00369 family)
MYVLLLTFLCHRQSSVYLGVSCSKVSAVSSSLKSPSRLRISPARNAKRAAMAPLADESGINTQPGIRSYFKTDYSIPVEARIQNLINELCHNPAYEGFDSLPLRQAKFISCDVASQSTKWEFTVTPILCNKGGNLHGGAAATLLDTLTSTALLCISKPGFLDAGHVSRNLNTTYLRPLPAGTKCIVECSVVAAGKNTAMVKGELKTLDGKIGVLCVHDKAVFKPKSTL